VPAHTTAASQPALFLIARPNGEQLQQQQQQPAAAATAAATTTKKDVHCVPGTRDWKHVHLNHTYAEPTQTQKR